MSEYEVIVIYEAGLTEEALEAQVELFRGFIDRERAELLEVQKWGRRRLAYEIKKKREGSYIFFRVKGKPTFPQAVERQLKFSEVVLRHLAVRVERAAGEKATTGAAASGAEREGS